MSVDRVKMEPGWKAALAHEFAQPYMHELREFLKAEGAAGKKIYPPAKDIFNAFNFTPLSQVKVLLLGQDPYHGAGQAHGLCFSVQRGTPPPPSLKNIYKEIATDLNIPAPKTGDLTRWAEQGVMLLNTVLTVEEGKAASHRNRGWEQFTDAVIRILAEQKRPLVFLLWGAFAQGKAAMVPAKSPHKIFKAPHPSPLSAHNGFFGCRHFSKTNQQLAAWGEKEIDWRLEK